MSHGIVAIEIGDQCGAAVWDFAAASSEELLVFGEKALEYNTAGRPDGTWSETCVASAGTVKEYRDLCIEYGRYEPRNQEDFVRMCVRCLLRYPPRAMLATSPPIGDNDALKIIQMFFALAPQLTKETLSNRPVANIVKRVKLGIKWAYLVGFSWEVPATIFVSGDSETARDLERRGLAHPADFKIQERW